MSLQKYTIYEYGLDVLFYFTSVMLGLCEARTYILLLTSQSYQHLIFIDPGVSSLNLSVLFSVVIKGWTALFLEKSLSAKCRGEDEIT